MIAGQGKQNKNLNEKAERIFDMRQKLTKVTTFTTLNRSCKV